MRGEHAHPLRALDPPPGAAAAEQFKVGIPEDLAMVVISKDLYECFRNGLKVEERGIRVGGVANGGGQGQESMESILDHPTPSKTLLGSLKVDNILNPPSPSTEDDICYQTLKRLLSERVLRLGLGRSNDTRGPAH